MPVTALAEADAVVRPPMPLVAELPRPDRSRYFINLPIDFLFIGGASIVLFLLMPHFHDGARTANVITVGMWLTWVGNWPHFSATSYRLYSSKERLRQYPFTAVAAPLIVLAGAVGCFSFPLLLTPYFIKLFLLWSPYHYSGQTLGISLLYARRGRHKPEQLERFFLSAFIYSTFIARTLRAETALAGSQYYGVNSPGFGIPLWIATAANAATYAFAGAFVLLLAHRTWKEKKAPPFLYLLPAITQYIWFYVAGTRPGYAELVPFFHGLQYLFIAWAMQLKETADLEGKRVTRRYVFGESARWYVWNLIGGAGLFYVLPLVAAHKAQVALPFASTVMLSAIQIHHFFVDGVIWKLKSQSVVSPLLVNIPALLERGEEAARPERASA